ncbi:PASTA domain-containing protein, partial [Nocardioides sp.]|uniref:PASTA domain-containing protein n=1 Tax=Nocardioides sp. TaxID=35761 RepID=UPI002C98ED73
DAMHPIQDTLQPIDFHPVDKSELVGTTADIPSVAGKSFAAARQALEAAGFHAARGPSVPSGYSAGTVAYGSPSGSAPTGSVIMLYISTGHAPAPPKKHKPTKHKHARDTSPPSNTSPANWPTGGNPGGNFPPGWGRH